MKGVKPGAEVVARSGQEAIRAVLSAIESAEEDARVSVALARSATRPPEDAFYLSIIVTVDGVSAALPLDVAARFGLACAGAAMVSEQFADTYAGLATMIRDVLDHVQTFGPNVQ